MELHLFLRRRSDVPAANACVYEAKISHYRWLEYVTAIDEDWRAQAGAEASEIELAKFLPLCHEHHRVSPNAASYGLLQSSTPGNCFRADSIATGSKARMWQPSWRRRSTISIDGALRKSSVFGLNASPSSATVESSKLPSNCTEFLNHGQTLISIDVDNGAQELRVRAARRCHVNESPHVFGEAGAPPADAGVKEMVTDSMVVPHTASNIFDVGAEAFADCSNLVYERDARRQEGVRSVFDHLGGTDVSD